MGEKLLTKRNVFMLMAILVWAFNLLLLFGIIGIINFRGVLVYPFPILGILLGWLYNRASPPAMDEKTEFRLAGVSVAIGTILLPVGLYVHA